MITLAIPAMILVSTLCLATTPLQQAFAHGGGLNRDGCHRETATGGYHCHRDDEDEVDWETAGYVLGGIVVLWLLYEAIKPPLLGASPLETQDTTLSPPPIGWRLGYDPDREAYVGVNLRLGF